MTTRAAILVAAALALTGVLAACSSGGAGSDARAGATTSVGPGATSASSPTPPAPADRRSSTRGAHVARPSVSGPITGGDRARPFNAMSRALADAHGYLEEEYFISGEATAYAASGSPTGDGRWTVAETSRAPYTTRLLVRRPADLRRFDGTVLVEWLNVSSGQDTDVEFAQAHDELLAHGTVWVGVSAQSVGVAGGASMAMPGLVPSPLKTWDPVRYASLAHPGDDYSYDMFSQAAAALLHPQGADPLAATPPRVLLAAGESQSAARMVTYVNAVHPVAGAFDGFLIHSRGDGGAPLRTGEALPSPARIRADLDVPVFQFETETDLLGLPFIDARQPDTDQLRTWEVAGTAHLDRHLLDTLRDAARPSDGAPAAAAGTQLVAEPAADPIEAQCGPVNDGPQAAVLSKAVAELRTWASGGAPPAPGHPIEVRDGAVARDEHGIALGGIRTPPVDVPLAALRGDNAVAGTYACSLFGSTTRFDAATLARRYPDRSTYVDAVERAARSAVDAGHLLEVDAQAFVDAARRDPRLP
jgi:hypothetical protein